MSAPTPPKASPSEARSYPEVPSQANFPALEEGVLAYWKQEGIFKESIAARPESKDAGREFVFYDGPPFANGLPHYGHLLTGYVKDIIPRFQTMRGARVERRFGWDCHGLPAEMATEKELGVQGRKKIVEFGIAKFNEHCRKSVLRYTGEWERYVTRQARWVDFERDYKTMDISYMESVLWAFKSLYDKGLVYESYRVMPYSWAAETPVSNFETKLDNAYRERQDPALTVRFRLQPKAGDVGPLDILAWTTTPWTLPSNLALAVGEEIEYAVLDTGAGVYTVLAEAACGKYSKELGEAPRVGTLKGVDLVGRTYEPMFPYFADNPDSFRILSGDFVDTSEGTGVVHMAPGFGEDDQRVCEENGIQLVCPVDESGAFTAEVSDYAGINVLEANKAIAKALKESGKVVRHESYLHSYPHCWRTDEPLIYRALSSWYVKVTDFKDRMVKHNQSIRWVPEHVRDGQFGRWLENARDWSISRNRFWGAPIPVWKSDDPDYPRIDVYGSLDELEADFGVRLTDLHRPSVDELTRPNPDDPTGKSTMRRVSEVFDCWFESGSMPYAQVHYPFENKEWFEEHFPADFITEYIAQTRGWFYTMTVLSTALFDRPPFQNVVCHGVVLADDGQKLSKRLKNYPDPDAMFNKHGSDALRWFLCSSPILRGADLQIDIDGKAIGEVVRLVLNPLWNAYSFFCLYANADGAQASERADATGVLDRYILAKTRALLEDVEASMDRYDIPDACSHLRGFLDALNNWYIRRSRSRFWKEEQDQDKRDAYDTLFTVLTTVCKLAAPLLPLIGEEIYRGLTGGRSVHLCDWPSADALPDDRALVADMDRVRAACSAALSLREEHRLRVRLPLADLTIAGA
ncbi:MAG: isoleucyl-tRNA synthetase, partial [Planctomycetota bacterium]